MYDRLRLCHTLQLRQSSRVRDHHQRWAAAQRTRESLVEVLRIERREALVEDDDLASLQQRAGHEQAAAFAVGELPAAVSHELVQTGRHPLQPPPEPQLP